MLRDIFQILVSLGAGASAQLTSNTIILQSIPRRIYIWARNNNSVLKSVSTLYRYISFTCTN